MYDLYGGNPIPNFMAIEEITNEEIYVGATASLGSSLAIKSFIYNKSGWPARMCDKLSFRYYMDLSEYVSAGYNPADISTNIVYSAADTATISKPQVYDASKNIYYIEVDLTGTKIYPGSNMDHQKEVQFNIQPPGGAPWDNANDFSYQGIMDDSEIVPKIPVYDNGVLIFGEEPDGSVPVTPPPHTSTPTPTKKNTPTPTPTTSSSPDVTRGDINLDGAVDSTDLTLLKRYVLRKLSAFPSDDPAKSLIAADANNDGSIDSTDITIVKRIILRKIQL
jgi:endoglucanase